MSSHTPCPRCAADIVRDGRYAVWCPSCEWNLGAEPPGRRSLGAVLADRLTAGQHAHVLRRGAALEGGGLSRATAMLLAALIHLVTAACVVAAVAVVVAVPNIVGVLSAVLLLGTAWLMRPRLGRLPAERNLLRRDRAPRLFGLLDRIGAEVGAPPVDVVFVVAEHNAAFGRIGLRGRRTLYLGAPLWAMLDPQEKVALLAHELSHSSNGDVRAGRLTGTAISALEEVHEVVRAVARGGRDSAEATAQSVVAMLSLALAALMWLAGLALRTLGFLLLAVSMRAARQGEYVADERAARLASSEAAAGMLDRLVTARIDTAELSWLAASFGTSVWTRLPDKHGQVPEHELERRRRLEARAERHVFHSHPPIRLRVEFVRSLGYAAPAVELGEEEAAAVEAELAPRFATIATVLGEERREVSYA
ncbi:M48 family metallopeptidase [Nonomuraea roseoviolacea]|uniref:Zn-dependent protease with chaperone function n=1 Tax=Nonomuraea roseoviolacea subsp. carminata TaxID=160689 RepID=A0ABT1KAR7_9ACTN|nr:M48 family metallopeptidase [Nonomuraea roseoviolacea]MCP2351098.1 Zn-dependent protease with chaperone function [Nonomuraea roseoviolacea subsp. carminata]